MGHRCQIAKTAHSLIDDFAESGFHKNLSARRVERRDEFADANFLDVIHFNYGRCLYRVDRKNAARQQFDLLVADYPESKLAEEAKRISDALVKAGF